MRKNKNSQKPPTLSESQIQSLKTFAASFYFLANEAEKDEFPYISIFLKEGISRIDNILAGKEQDYLPKVIDESLFNAMSFLYGLSQLSPKVRSDFANFFGDLKNSLMPNQEAEKRGNIKGLVNA